MGNLPEQSYVKPIDLNKIKDITRIGVNFIISAIMDKHLDNLL